MGCVAAYIPGPYRSVYSDSREAAMWRRDYETLRFEEPDVGRLYDCFLRIDTDKSGEIDIAELFVNVNLELTPFTQRIFTLFDGDGSGKVDFHEMVLCLWSYCTLNEDELLVFAMELYDTDNSGELDRKEVNMLLEDVYGKSYDTNPMAKALAVSVDQLPDRVGIDDMRDFCRQHVLLLFPAFEVQSALVNFFVGRWFWDRIAVKRKHVSNNAYIPIRKFMKMFSAGTEEGEKQKQWQYQQDRALAGRRKPKPKRDTDSVTRVTHRVAPVEPKAIDHQHIIHEAEAGQRGSKHVTQDRSANRTPRRDSNASTATHSPTPSHHREPISRDRRPTDNHDDPTLSSPTHLQKPRKADHHEEVDAFTNLEKEKERIESESRQSSTHSSGHHHHKHHKHEGGDSSHTPRRHKHSDGDGDGHTHRHKHGDGDGHTHRHKHGDGDGHTHRHKHGDGDGHTHRHKHSGGDGHTHRHKHSGGDGHTHRHKHGDGDSHSHHGH